mmetsp:Transcript_43570/g.48810  ORF Transcript_43570/g.48810 Transcript_43570/m.48810 type:complete len:90 (-) Transcript_43570:1855-2124(-)
MVDSTHSTGLPPDRPQGYPPANKLLTETIKTPSPSRVHVGHHSNFIRSIPTTTADEIRENMPLLHPATTTYTITSQLNPIATTTTTIIG